MGGDGWVALVITYIVNQSLNPWILGFDILDLDFGIDIWFSKNPNSVICLNMGGVLGSCPSYPDGVWPLGVISALAHFATLVQY